MPISNGGHHVEHTILLDDISTLFSEALEKFEPISGQPMDSYLVELCEVLSQIPLVVTYDKANGVHNLFEIIQDHTTYMTYYTSPFPQPRKPAIYNVSIDGNEKAPFCA